MTNGETFDLPVYPSDGETADEEDLFLYDQLPNEVRAKILTDFLYKDFMLDFRRVFTFRRDKKKSGGI